MDITFVMGQGQGRGRLVPGEAGILGVNYYVAYTVAHLL